MSLSIQQAAAQLNVREDRLRALVAAGRVKAIERHVIHLGIEQAEVDRILSEKARTGCWPGAGPVGRPTPKTKDRAVAQKLEPEPQSEPEWGDYDVERLSTEQAAKILQMKPKQVLLLENSMKPVAHPQSGRLALLATDVQAYQKRKLDLQEGF
jgi:hypothetical protein